jgi:hypothetical protein
MAGLQTGIATAAAGILPEVYRLVNNHSAPEVLTAGHGQCKVSVHQTRRGAIPEANGQQNADGFGLRF